MSSAEVINLSKVIADYGASHQTVMAELEASKNAVDQATARALATTAQSGTFTPHLIGSTVAGEFSYSIQEGDFYQIGNLVHASGRIFWTDIGSAEGPIKIGGLPFASRSGTRNRIYVPLPWYNSLNANTDVELIHGFVSPGQSEINLVGVTNIGEGTNTLLSAHQLSSAGEIYFNAIYRKSA